MKLRQGIKITRFRVGEDLSYWLGPDARCATAEQCRELERTFAEADREARDCVRILAGERP